MTYLDRAIKDGYAIITGPENKQKIIYVTSDNHTENYNDPEEKVRAEFWAELIYEYDYPAHRLKVEVTIPDRVPTDRADIVIFSDDECKKPYAVVECKRDGVTDAEFLQAIEQGVGNATWVKLRASYVVIIAGATRRVLDFSDDSTGILERENNIIADLPKAYGKPQAFRFYRGGEYTDVDGKKKKAPDIQPVAREDLITAIKKCHNTLWGGGRLSPPTAFGELCKLIFVKISDEQKPRKKGEPYQFQIKTHEPSSKLAERINALYNEQKVKDPEVFTDSIKVDDRVLRTVVSHLESINLNKTDLDVKGVAFEQFMDGFFKGDFGQYFTPRPIIEFAVKMMKPEHDWDVLDPACGSGGFLLHALDYMRSQASEYYDKDTVDCMQNGKSCIVDKMPTEIGFGSTEFHVIRKRNENVYMPFIWAILSSDDVLKAAQATFSGSAGQQRVSASFIENFPAVLPDYPVQVRLVAELEDKLNLLNGKLQRAYELLHKTPMYLIDRLGLTFDFSATQKITYATTVANIEGRIDADYYSPKFSHFRSQIEALPYRTVSVDDISLSVELMVIIDF